MTVRGVLHSRAAGPRAGVRRRLHRAYRRGVRTDAGAAAATDVGLDGEDVELDATAGAAAVARGVLAAMQQLDTTTSSTTTTSQLLRQQLAVTQGVASTIVLQHGSQQGTQHGARR